MTPADADPRFLDGMEDVELPPHPPPPGSAPMPPSPPPRAAPFPAADPPDPAATPPLAAATPSPELDDPGGWPAPTPRPAPPAPPPPTVVPGATGPRRFTGQGRAPARRVRRVIRRVDTWTVLRVSILFYLSVLVVLLVAGGLLWAVASAAGVIHNFEKFIKDLFSLDSFHLAGTAILEATAIGGLVLVIIGTGCNVLVAVIYNLISDVVGGVEVTVLEEDSSPRPVV